MFTGRLRLTDIYVAQRNHDDNLHYFTNVVRCSRSESAARSTCPSWSAWRPRRRPPTSCWPRASPLSAPSSRVFRPAYATVSKAIKTISIERPTVRTARKTGVFRPACAARVSWRGFEWRYCALVLLCRLREMFRKKIRSLRSSISAMKFRTDNKGNRSVPAAACVTGEALQVSITYGCRSIAHESCVKLIRAHLGAFYNKTSRERTAHTTSDCPPKMLTLTPGTHRITVLFTTPCWYSYYRMLADTYRSSIPHPLSLNVNGKCRILICRRTQYVPYSE